MTRAAQRRKCVYALFHITCLEKDGKCPHVHRDENELWSTAPRPKHLPDAQGSAVLLRSLVDAATAQEKSTTEAGAGSQAGQKRLRDGDVAQPGDATVMTVDGDDVPPAKRTRADTDGADPSALPPSPALTPTTDVLPLPALSSLSRPSSHSSPGLLPLSPSPTSTPAALVTQLPLIEGDGQLLAELSVEIDKNAALTDEIEVLTNTIRLYRSQLEGAQSRDEEIEELRAHLSVEEELVADIRDDLAKALATTTTLEPLVEELKRQGCVLRRQLTARHEDILVCANLVSLYLEEAFGNFLPPTTVAPDGGLRAMLAQQGSTISSTTLLYQIHRCVDFAVRSARQAFDARLLLAMQPFGSLRQAVGGGEGAAEAEDEEDEEESVDEDDG